MYNADLPSEAATLILLDKSHRLAELIVTEAHQWVQHNKVKATLTEVRSRYWLVKGRQFVRNLIYKCVTWCHLERRPYSSIPPPPLPDFRVKQSQLFSCTGVDFTGPMYVKVHNTTGGKRHGCTYTLVTSLDQSTLNWWLDWVQSMLQALYCQVSDAMFDGHWQHKDIWIYRSSHIEGA